MKKVAIVVVICAAIAGTAFYSGLMTRESSAQAAGAQVPGAEAAGAPAGRGGPASGRGGRGRGGAGPMTVEVATATRGTVAQQLTVVGNLIGDATVEVVPRASGRLQEIYVRLGDRVTRGQRIAKIEDFELQEQVKQAEAALEVSRATIRQREADLKLAETNAERSRNLFARQLLPKQALDDTEARYQAAVAQLDLARAQNTQSTARLDELRINLANTVVVSPVNGFVARRNVDRGAFVGQNAPIVDVVDISRVRLVANVVEKDLKDVQAGDTADVEVDAYPGEVFAGRIARVAPVLDPATRTAPIEVEIPNANFRLKPGMYARVTMTTDQKRDAVIVPPNAVVDVGGRRGVFLALENNTATFRPVRVGIEQGQQVEILEGLTEGERIVATGAGALRDGDRFVIAGTGRGGPGGTAERGRAGRDAAAGPAATGEAAPSDRAMRGERGGMPREGAAAAQQPRVGGEGTRPDGHSGFAGRGRRGQPPGQ